MDQLIETFEYVRLNHNNRHTDSNVSVDPLAQNINKGNMVEILVPNALDLTLPVSVVAFSDQDAELIRATLLELNVEWLTECIQTDLYEQRPEYATSCKKFLRRTLDDPEWFGDGLEFDKV